MKETAQQKDVGYSFASTIVGTTYDQLPEKAVEAAKKSILDTLGVMAAASGTTPALGGVVEVVREMGGKPESTVIGFGGKFPAMMAAFANGAMVHCLDYDDVEFETLYHPSSAVMPAGFAAAERVGSVGGRDFITAVALGQDLGIRLARAIPVQRKPPWHRSVVMGTFASAATAARILKLDQERVVDSMGIAFCQTAGSLELRWGVGTALGGMYSAFPAKAGVLSAILAERGVSGLKNCFEGKAGLFNLYFEGKYDRVKLTNELGRRFLGGETGFKPWPACAATNTYVVGVTALMKENSLRAEEVDRVTVYCGDFARTLCEPLAARQKPAAAIDAKYSIPYTVAVAALKGNVLIDDYEPAMLGDPAILQMARRVEPKFEEAFNITDGVPPGAIEIRTKQGETFSRKVTLPYGHPGNPLTWEGIKSKFRDCVKHSIHPIPRDTVEKIIESVEGLERSRDVGEIVRLLSPQ